jgi:hypothetical protein
MSKATRGSNLATPVAMTPSVARMVPTHRLTVMRPIESMRRYSSAMLSTPTPAATSSMPRSPRPVQMKVTYFAKPM